MVEAAEPVDALDGDDPVGLHRDEGTHLLQDRDEVHDLGLDGGVAQGRRAPRPHRREEHLLGRPDARVRQPHVGRVQPPGGGEPQAVAALLDLRPELAQHVEVVVDRPLSDAAAAEVGDERLAQPVQQRAAEEHRDAGGARVGVDVGDVGLLDVGRVQDQLAVTVGGVDDHTMKLEQTAHHLHVGDLGDPAQAARLLGEDDGHHRLGDEVLGTPDLDVADERCAAVDDEGGGHAPSQTQTPRGCDGSAVTTARRPWPLSVPSSWPGPSWPASTSWRWTSSRADFLAVVVFAWSSRLAVDFVAVARPADDVLAVPVFFAAADFVELPVFLAVLVVRAGDEAALRLLVDAVFLAVDAEADALRGAAFAVVFVAPRAADFAVDLAAAAERAGAFAVDFADALVADAFAGALRAVDVGGLGRARRLAGRGCRGGRDGLRRRLRRPGGCRGRTGRRLHRSSGEGRGCARPPPARWPGPTWAGCSAS